MKTKMKQLLTSGFGVKLLVFFGLVLGLTLPNAAQAAAPVAVWNKDLAGGSTKGAFTMTLDGSTTSASDGVVTMTQTSNQARKGIVVTWTDGAVPSPDMTVVVRYSGFNPTTSRNAMIAARYNSTPTEVVTSCKEKEIDFAYGTTASAEGTHTVDWRMKIPTEGLMVATYIGSGSTVQDRGARIAFAEKKADGSYGPLISYGRIGHDDGSASRDFLSASTRYTGIEIGGTLFGTSAYHRPGMVVDGVAIYSNAESMKFVGFPGDDMFYPITVSGYASKTSYVTIPNVTMASLQNGRITAQSVGGSMHGHGGVGAALATVVDGSNYKAWMCAEDDGHIKAVQVQFEPDGADVKFKALQAGYVAGSDQLYLKTPEENVTTSTSWSATGTGVATSDAGSGYGYKNFTVNLFYNQVANIATGVNWGNIAWKSPTNSNTSASAPASGDYTRMTVTGTSTVTMDAAAATGVLKVYSFGSNKLTLKYTAANTLTAGTVDFTCAAGKVAFDTTGLAAPATLVSGTIVGADNIDIEGSTVEAGTELIVNANEIKIIEAITTGAAKIGGTSYETVALAFAAVQDGQTVVLLQACTETLTAPDKSFTLALNGFAMSGSLATADNKIITLTYGTGGSFTSPVTGGGTLAIPALPTGAFLTSLGADTWTGTLWMKGVSVAGQNLTGYGNASSKVKMSGCSGHLNSSGSSLTHPYVLVLENDSYDFGLNVNNGWSGQYMKFAGLEGSGTLKTTKPSSGAPTVQYIFTEASSFSGSIDNSVANGLMSVVLDAGNDFTPDYDTYQGKILALGTTTVASGKTWNGRAGIVVNGTLNNNGTLTGTVTGTGTIVYDSATVSAFPSTAPTGLNVADWTGTVWFKGYDTEANRSVTGFRNASSTVKFTSVKAWFNGGDSFSRMELEDAGNTPALNISNGSSGWSAAKSVTITALTGTGTLKTTWNHSTAFPLLLKDVSDFHGSLSAAASTAGNGIGILIGPNVTYATKDAARNQIVLDSGATANIDSGKSWSASNGIFVNGTLNNYGTISGTINGSGTIVYRAASTGTGVNFGNPSTVLGNQFTGTMQVSQGRYEVSGGFGTFSGKVTNGGQFYLKNGFDLGTTGLTASGNGWTGDSSHPGSYQCAIRFDGGATVTGNLTLVNEGDYDYVNVGVIGSATFNGTLLGSTKMKLKGNNNNGTLDMSGATFSGTNPIEILTGSTLKLGGKRIENVVSGAGTVTAVLTAAEVAQVEGGTAVRLFKVSGSAPTTVTVTDSSSKAYVTQVVDGYCVVPGAILHTHLGWNGTAWTNDTGTVVSMITTDHILDAKDGDSITFSTAAAPYAFNMPTTGTVTINDQGNLTVGAINILEGSTLVLCANVAPGFNVTGAGTLALNMGSTTEATDILGGKLSAFAGTLHIDTGRYIGSTAINAAVKIKVTDGGQFCLKGGTWQNYFELSGNGVGTTLQTDIAALSARANATISGTVDTGAAGAGLGAYNATLTISGPVKGNGFTTYGDGSADSRNIIFTAPSTQFVQLTGPVEVKCGCLVKYGNSDSAGSSDIDYTLGSALTITSGEVQLWLTQNNVRRFTTPITMNGGKLSSQDGKYTFSSVTIAAASTISMAWGKTFTFTELHGSANLTLTQYQSEANGSFVISGGDYSGTITASSNSNTDFKPTGTALDDATVVLNSNMKLVTDNTTVIKLVKMGVNNCLKDNTAYVNAGTTLDYNGMGNYNNSFTLNGGALINTGNAISFGTAQMNVLTVNADSIVGCTNSFGMVNSGYAAHDLNLGANTLRKLGPNTFFLTMTTVKGTGTIEIDEGTLEVTANAPDKGTPLCTFNEGTIQLDAGTLKVNSSGTLSLHGLTVNGGTISNSGTLNGLAVLNGTVDFNNIGGTVGFADAVTVASGTTALSEAASTALAGKTVTVNGTLDCGTYRPTLTLDSASTGTVIVKLTDDTAFNAGTAIPLFTVSDGTSFAGTIRVFDSKGSERTIKALAFAEGKVVIQRSEDDKLPPFNLTNPTGSVAWTAEGWMDSSESPKSVASTDWNKTVGANIALASGEATRTLDRSISLSTLNITNAGTLAIADAGDFTLTATTIDDSTSTGATTLNFALGSANVTAGANTTIAKGGTTATLTVGAGKKATLAAGATMGGYNNVAGGTIRFEGERGEVAFATYMPTAGNYEFKNATITGNLKGSNYANRKLVVQNGDVVTINQDADGSGYRCADISVDVREGGSLTYAPTANTWFHSTVKYSQSGGLVTFNANGDGSANAKSVIFGYSGGNTISVNISGGTTDISKTSIWFDQNYTIALSGTGILKVKGFTSNADKSNAVTVGDTAQLWIGSNNWRANTGTLTLNGGTLKAFEDSTVNAAITVSSASTLSAAAGKTMTVTGALSGSGALTIGTAEDTGAVKFASTDVMGSTAITVNDAATIKVGITDHQYASGLTLSNVTLGEGRNITFVLPNGTEVQGSGNTINVSHYWYEFNGNTTASSTASLTLGDADPTKCVYVVTSHGQALKTSDKVSPYFENCDQLTGDWSVITFAKTIQKNGGAVWTLGYKANSGGGGIALVSDGTNGVKLGKFNTSGEFSTTEGEYIAKADIDASNRYHSYAAVKSGSTLSLYVDGAKAGEISYSGTLTSGKGQFGGTHGGGSMRADGTCIDDWKLFKMAVSEVYLAGVARDFSPWPCDTISISFKDNDGTAANNVQVADDLYAGVHPIIGTSWNNLVGQHGSGANFTKLTTGLTERLIDGTTLASTAAATISGNCTYYAAGGTHVSGNGQMTFNYIDDGANPNDSTKGAGVKVEAIPYAEYTLYIYMGSDSTKTDKKFRPVEVLTNGVAVAGLPTENWGRLMSAKEVDNALTLVENENYLKVEGLTAETIQIWGSKGSDNNRCGIAAVQIVRTGARRPTPAPFTAVISASGDWANGAGENLTEKSETWTDSYLRSIILTNSLASGYLNFDSNVKAAGLTIVGGADKTIDLTVAQNMTPHFSAFDFSETLGAVTNRVATGTASVAAGADTVLTQAGSGTLTIGTGKQATIPGWTDAATKITGAGDLVVDTGAKATEFQVASFAYTGTFTLKRGTWNANKAHFPTGRANLFFDGADAQMIVNEGDTTGYGKGLPKIEFMNGATIRFNQRDTFSRELVLRNGANVTMVEPSSGRSLDFYNDNAKISVYGSGTTSTIGGTTAGTISGSGLISIRRDEFEMFVDTGATLDIWSQWGYNSEAGSLERACKKTGEGTVIFRRAPAQTGTYSVNAGALKMVDAGAPTLGEIALASGTTLELSSDSDQVVANAITGEGTVTKTGTGTITLTGANSFAGITIEAGKIAATTNSLGSATITIGADGKLQIDMNDFATVVKTTEAAVFNFADDASAGRLEILNGDKYPWLSIGTTGTDRGKIVVDDSKLAITGLHIIQMCPKPSYGVRDPNGRESGWVELVNYGPEAVDLKDYKLCRANMGKAFKTEVDNLLAKTLQKGDTFLVYMTEDYPTAEDYGGNGTDVKCFKTVDGEVKMFDTWQEGGVMAVPTKVNPKKVPLVRLYQYGNGATNVIDEVVVPCDIDDDAIVGLESITNKVSRYVMQKSIRTAYGPEVMSLYGLTKKDKGVTDIALLNTHAGFIPTTEDFEIAFPVNPFKTDAKVLEPNEIKGVTLVYRVFKTTGDMEEVEIEMAKGENKTDSLGQLWTNSIPASVLAANPGALIQYRAKITEADNTVWTAPRFLNKDIGYEWYGAVIQPTIAELPPTAETVATTTDVCTNKLQTILLFTSGENTTEMDKDILNQDRSKVPYGARVQIYDTQTHTYYDNVRIDLRGQTSAGFTKKSHGLRFSKVAPLTCVDPFTENEYSFRKTSFMAEYGDPSFLRQVLSCRLLGDAGVKVPFDYPVRLYLNGKFYQLAFHSNRFTDEIVEDYYGLNKFGYSYKNIGMFAPNNKGPKDGVGTEKKTPDDDNEADMTVLNQYTARFSASKFDEGQSLSEATKAQLTKVAMTNFNIAAWINYLAAVRITQECDDVWTNLGGYINKYDEWYNPNGDDTLMPLAYDLNLSWGQWYWGDDHVDPRPGIYATNDWFKCHPFYGGWQVRAHKKTDSSTMANANYAYETLYQNAQYREMFLRRIRTLMDRYIGAPGTAKEDTPVWDWVVAYTNAFAGDVAADHQKWNYTAAHMKQNVSAIWVWENAPTLDEAVEEIWTGYIVPRRTHLYCTHSTTNDQKAVGYDKDLSAGIPFEQAATETLGKHGALYFTDAEGLKPGETGFNLNVEGGIIGIVNTNNVAIDVSDWTVEGALVATLKPGTVIPANSVLWIVENRQAASKLLAEATDGTDYPVIVNLDKTLVDKKGKRLEYFDAKATDQLILKDADGTPAITHEATIGTKYYITLLDAFNCAETNDIVALLTDIDNQTPAAVKTSVILYGDTNTLTGAGFDVADGQTLTIASGQIANGALAKTGTGAIVLIGGKYTEESKTAYTGIVSNQYHMAALGLVADEDPYKFQVVPGEAPADPTTEVLLPVAEIVYDTTITNDVGNLAFTTNWIVKAGLATAEQLATKEGRKDVVDKLNTHQANKIQVWENKVLGLDGSVEANIPVILPKQTKDATKVTFKMANQDKVSTDSGAIVTYKVWMGSTPKGKDIGSSEAVLYTQDTAMPLPEKGVQYYMLEVITTPAK